MRDFFRYHFFKALMVLVALQLGVFAWLQYRNHRPVAKTDSVEVYAGQSVNIKPVRNDTDKDDGDELELVYVDEPQHGNLDRVDDALIYTSSLDFVGVDSFKYQISDGKKHSKYEYIKVSVNENEAPIAKIDKVQMYRGSSLLIAPLGNDSDKEGDSLFISAYTQPVGGELSTEGVGFIYTPNGSRAIDSFNYTLSDGFSTTKSTVLIEIKSKTDVCYPWLSADIGNVDMKGSLKCSGGKYTLNASGSDIWENTDGFHFAYQVVDGDFEFIAKIEKLEDTHEWAKAGIMVREGLAGGSTNAFLGVTARHGISSQCRPETNSGTENIGGNAELTTPCWLKLKRSGDSIALYSSANGKNWAETGSVEIEFSDYVYIGMAATSHDNGVVGEVVYSNVKTN